MPLHKSPIDLVIVREIQNTFVSKAERTVYGADSQVKVAEAIKRIAGRASIRIAALADELELRRQKCREEVSIPRP